MKTKIDLRKAEDSIANSATKDIIHPFDNFIDEFEGQLKQSQKLFSRAEMMAALCRTLGKCCERITVCSSESPLKTTNLSRKYSKEEILEMRRFDLSCKLADMLTNNPSLPVVEKQDQICGETVNLSKMSIFFIKSQSEQESL